MAGKKKHKPPVAIATPSNVESAPVRAAASPLRPPLPAWKKWLFRLAAMTLLPLCVLAVLEIGLRAVGFGVSTEFFVDGARADAPGYWIDHPDFGRWVFPAQMEPLPRPLTFALPKEKPAKTCRIFVLGESAALGFPDPSTSFARVLEVMLRAEYPETSFEVLNASMVAINSHVAREIASQCATRQPDIFVILLGNNEVIGPFGVAGVLGRFSPNMTVIRINLAIRAMRLGQAFGSFFSYFGGASATPGQWNGLAMFAESHLRADDTRLEAIYQHFRTNLEQICSATSAAGASTFVCTVPVNLRDCPPFGSRHASDLTSGQETQWSAHFESGKRWQSEQQFAKALDEFAQAMAIDGTYAELPFRMGQCQLALGNAAEAASAFASARDLDTLRFRTDSRLNEIIKKVAAERAGNRVRWVDAEAAFAAASPQGIPGDELFLEHVHFTFRGNWLLARTVAEAFRGADLPLGRPSAAGAGLLDEAECRRRLAHTDWHEWKFGTVVFQQLIQGPPFVFQFDHDQRTLKWQAHLKALEERLRSGGRDEALSAVASAQAQSPRDWMIGMKKGDLLAELGRFAEARREYEKVAALLPSYFAPWFMLGSIDLKEHRPNEAEQNFLRAMRLAPHNVEARIGLASSLEARGKFAESLAALGALVAETPGRAPPRMALGQFLLRMGKHDLAKARFAEVLTLDPNNVEAHVELGSLALGLGRREEAVDHFEAALKLNPALADVRAALDKLRTQRPSR